MIYAYVDNSYWPGPEQGYSYFNTEHELYNSLQDDIVHGVCFPSECIFMIPKEIGDWEV